MKGYARTGFSNYPAVHQKIAGTEAKGCFTVTSPDPVSAQAVSMTAASEMKDVGV